MAVETIPLPQENITQGRPFEVTVEDLTAWPDQTIRVEFEYNPHMRRWIWQAVHIGEGRIVLPSVATLAEDYVHWPYIRFAFIIPGGGAGDVRGITTDTLGDPVKLACYPGPLGGQFLQDSGFTAEEERAMLDWGGVW